MKGQPCSRAYDSRQAEKCTKVEVWKLHSQYKAVSLHSPVFTLQQTLSAPSRTRLPSTRIFDVIAQTGWKRRLRIWTWSVKECEI